MTNCREQLASLPPLIEDDPATYILNEIIAFSSGFQQYVKGGSASSAYLIQSHKDVYGDFKVAIRKTAPNFVPYTDKESSNGWNGTEDDEDDNGAAVSDNTDNSSVSSDSSGDDSDDEDKSDAMPQREEPQEVNPQKPFNLTAMKKYIKRLVSMALFYDPRS